MARFSNFCLMVTFMASATLLVKTGLSYEDYDPLEGSPMSSTEKQMLDCILKLHPPCDALYMFGTIVTGNETVSKDCCTHIVHDFGKQCHDIMTMYIISLPKYKANRTQFLQRSKQVWNECSHHSSFKLDDGGLGHTFASDDSPSPSPSPSLSSHEKYLEECAVKLYPDCGNQLYSAIFFDNDTISKECCENLVKDVGKSCNDQMTLYILGSPQFKKNETQILRRSNEIWKECKG
ncbi:hypothetical protein Fmac_014140 [Flemingia macrophylla]|uniref:Prolamin-like domain-containing protein n=1 Tax=Flemingia macrophylla TaxID=520843 RepID=A0ABD1MBD9_9FABA